MTFISFILLLFGLFQPFQDQLSADPEVYEPDSVNSMFIIGVEDLFWQTGWEFSSMERMSVMIGTDDHGYYGPQPTFMLDGVPFSPGFFGVHYSQLFPVSLFRIERLEVDHGAGIRAGQPYQSGLMNLESETVQQGLSVFGSGQLGHNSGEPGPWVFDPENVTPNVERFGPWLDGGLSLRFGGWYVKGSIRHHDYLNIDESIQTRIINLRGIPEENIWLRTDAISTLGMAETGIIGERNEIRLQAVRSESEDFLFFQPLGREIPTGFQSEQYSAKALFYFTSNTGVRALYQYRDESTQFRPNVFDSEIGWAQTLQTARGSVFYNGNRFGIEAGSEYIIKDVTARQTEFDREMTPSAFLEGNLQLAGFIQLITENIYRFYDHDAAFSTKSAFEIRPLKNWTLQIGGGYTRMVPEQTHPLDRWIINGYDLFEHLQISAVLPDELTNNSYSTVFIENRFSISQDWNVDIGLSYFRHYSLMVPFQQVEYDLPFSTQPGLYSIHDNQSGERLAARLKLLHQPSSRFSQLADISIRHTLNGDEVYRNYWKMLPEYRVNYSAMFTPYPDLELRLDAQYLTEREWSEFENIDGELNRNFHLQFPFRYSEFTNTLPQHLKIDVRVSKWLWGQRLRTVLHLKNLLNRDFQSHPIGVREGFGYMARIEIRF